MDPNFHNLLNLAWDMKAAGDHPAAVIGAWHLNDYRSDTEGPVPVPLAPVLNNSLTSIAPLNTNVNGNNIGCCCEVRSSNQILEPKQNLVISDISFRLFMLVKFNI